MKTYLPAAFLIFLACAAPHGDSGKATGAPYSPLFATGYYSDDPIPDKTAYLTFDDGPSDWTAEILDILKKEKIHATFFICGVWAPDETRKINAFEKYRPALVRMMDEGHVPGNHTIDHKNLAALSPARIAAQVDDNQKLFDAELGAHARHMTLIRPPFGSPYQYPASGAERRKVSAALARRGIVILWSRHFDSSDSKEWVRGEWYEKGPRINISDAEYRRKMQRIYVRLISRANGGGIVILFHDTHPTTRDILRYVIDKLKSEGYRFATMEEYVRWRWNKSSGELVREFIRNEGRGGK